MRSFETSTPVRRVAPRAPVRNALAELFAVLLVFSAGGAGAAPLPAQISDAQVQIVVGTLAPLAVTQTGNEVNPTGSRVAPGGALTAISIPAPPALISGMSVQVPVTDPAAAPIKGIVATASNAAANFAAIDGGGFGGTMPLVGVNKVCLFGPCSAAVANLNVPVGVVGLGGTAFVTGAVNLTVVGAPWTTRTAAIGTVSVMGGMNLTEMGGQGSPQIIPGVGGTQMTVDTVSLVTPVFVSTNIGASAVVPVFGIFSFTITTTTPEPAAIAALGASIAALVAVGMSRRRRS